MSQYSQIENQSLACEDETDDPAFEEGLQKKKNRIPTFKMVDFEEGGSYFGVKIHTHCLPSKMMVDILQECPTIWKKGVQEKVLAQLHSFLPPENRVRCDCEYEEGKETGNSQEFVNVTN